MNRLTISAALTVLLLGACAAEPEAPQVVAAPAEPVAEAPPPPPAPAPAPEPVAAPAPAPEPAKAEAPAPAPDKRTLVYLASYKTEATAMRGWKILAKASPVLAKQTPVTTKVDLGKKGKFVRLYGMAADEAERASICKQVGKRVDECGARNRE
ncbi:MAG TPA: hypothetical protein VLL76_10580 [Candidatus Omnitrophota bacterium]|nr:hypothetical protein [Candidatus Omnitrophota bacterium]